MKSGTAGSRRGATTPTLRTQRSYSASSATRPNKRIEVMKAIVIRAYGGHKVMKLDDVELPAPGAGEALVDVAVSGVNFMDTGTRRRFTKGIRTLPVKPGSESAGARGAACSGGTNGKDACSRGWF